MAPSRFGRCDERRESKQSSVLGRPHPAHVVTVFAAAAKSEDDKR